MKGGLRHALTQTLCHFQSCLQRGPGHDDHALLTAKTRAKIFWPQVRAHPLGEGTQSIVADHMPEIIVDIF